MQTDRAGGVNLTQFVELLYNIDMFKSLAATPENARAAQALIRDHYVRLGIWSLYEVTKFIANPDDPALVADQERRLKTPDSNVNKAGNLPPRYGGIHVGGELVALIKAGAYRSPARVLAEEPPYMNIHELVVADQEIYQEAIVRGLAFGRDVLKIHPDEQASIEVFALAQEIEPFEANGFAIEARDVQAYDFGSQTATTVHKLVRPNLRDPGLRVVKTT